MTSRIEYENQLTLWSWHRDGYVRVMEVLPLQHRKVKNVEKLVAKEHKKLVGMTDINAKYRYVQLARALKSYGITSFHVKEPVKDKKGRTLKQKKDVIIGVMRDSVVRMDSDTKEILNKWEFTKIKRWASSEHSFTMDMGDNHDDYLTFLTNQVQCAHDPSTNHLTLPECLHSPFSHFQQAQQIFYV